MNRAILLSVLVLVSFPTIASAQVATGLPAFSTFGGRRIRPIGPEPVRPPIGMVRSAVGGAGSSFSTSFANGGPYVINLGNLNVHLDIPILHKPGRGGDDFNYDLGYDSSVWQPIGTSGFQSWQPVANWGWTGLVAATSGYYTYGTTTVLVTCTTGGHVYKRYYNDQFNVETYYDASNTPHTVNGTVQDPVTGEGCVSSSNAPTSLRVLAGDSSGFTYQIQAIDTYPSLGVYTSSGATLSPSAGSPSPSNTVQIDRNGNEISYNAGVFTDTTGNTALTVAGSGTPTSPYTFTYTAPSGAAATYTVKYASYTVQTSFACTGVSDYGATPKNLVSEIDLPDDNPSGTRDRYVFGYEQTPGHSGAVTMRLASITLPTGGQILFSYSGTHNGIVCSDGSAAGLSIQTPDGTWSYARSGATTTVTDPQGNQTVLSFTAASGTFDYFETQRQVYQLENGVQTLLETINTCYNGTAMPCNGSNFSLPITEVAATTEPAGTGNLEAEHVSLWNSNGLPTEFDDYDYGTGTRGSLLRKESIQYMSLGNSLNDFSQTVTVYDGGSNVDSQTTYIYDQGSVVATSGTPQHTSITGARGNATSIDYETQGASYLTQSITYFDTGNIDVATDVNGGTTTYNYSSESASCGNSFPTGVTEAISGLSKSFTWNCVGGVPATATDENGQTTTLAWTDPYFWRPASLTDPTNAVTNYSYFLNPTQTESSLNFSSSTITHLLTFDSMGRPHVAQTLEAPGSTNYDSVETDYDTLGRPDKVTLPYVGTNGQTNSTAPNKAVTYDTLGRPMSVTDSSGLSITYTYSDNDVYVTVNAPSGENSKRKQYQFDGLGRLSSVCEITSGTGSGNCPQTDAKTGYYTQYTYNALGKITGVSQSGQARYYTYDEMGRITSETNPESGTTNYFWDAAPPSCYNNTGWPTPGALGATEDNAGVYTCYSYDALQRLTGYTSTAAGHTCGGYVYDTATPPSGITVYNGLGRLINAYTNSACDGRNSLLTDEWFSYDARGEVSGLYESTPHSSGYYHTVATYWPNGVPQDIYVPGGYWNAYSVDGEGRIVSNGDTFTGTLYNAASQPTQVTFNSTDNDTFTYDPNSARMTQYNFNVGGQSVVGQLGWNANGTLEQLAITDPFNSANQQTCNYTHDDLARIATASCTGGSGFSGSYSYDAFGNLTKSGTDTFNATYNSATNQMSSIGGQTPSYDANGDVTNDFLHTYSWDAYGRPATVDGVGVTYDALGRMVEQERSGAYTEFEYSPTGFKMEKKNGQTRVAAWVPLTGGAVAVYNASGFIYTQHGDWLGSGRFASTPSHTMYYDQAVGPFGEPYAQAGTPAPNFTGKNQDTASNVYDFPAREYGIQGRWPSPDPAGIAAVNPMDPQTWNRYAYVRNSPLSMIDPFGMDDIPLSKIIIGSDTTCGLACWPNPFEISFMPGPGDMFGPNGVFGNLSLGPNPFSGGGGASGSGNSQRPCAPAGNNPLTTAGIGGSGVAEAGLGNGGVLTGSGDVLNSSNTPIAFQGTYGSYNGQGSVPHVYGAYVGGGLEGTISNGEPGQMGGPFKVFSVQIGLGIWNAGAQIACSGNVCQYSFTSPGLSGGLGVAISTYQTNSAVATTGCKGKG